MSDTPDHQRGDIELMMQSIKHLETRMSELYIPKHVDHMMEKIGRIELGVQTSSNSISFCFTITFMIMMLFMIVLAGLVYLYWTGKLQLNLGPDKQQTMASQNKRRRRPKRWAHTVNRFRNGVSSDPEYTYATKSSPVMTVMSDSS